jgi:hypothetical protein
MPAWLLLVLTLACAALMVHAFLSGGERHGAQVGSWPREWKRGLDHVRLGEQERVFRSLRYPLLGTGTLAWLYVALTLLLLVLTLRAFLH